MRPLSGLGIGLSLVFGCLFLALIAEVYYLLWWKKMANRDVEDDYAGSPRELLYLFCRRKPAVSLRSAALNPQGPPSPGRTAEAPHQVDQGSGKEFLIKPLGSEDTVEAELMRLHNLAGPPRFLFTITEETKEDMESDDGKSRGDGSGKRSTGRSLGDIFAAETPFLTPLSSPPFFTPPLTPTEHCYGRQGFNPLFESYGGDDRSSRTRSSPPPKFKFLRDAEDKLYRRTLMEEALKVSRNRGLAEETAAKSAGSPAPGASADADGEEEGPFVAIIISKSKEQGQQPQHHSSSAQVIPLPPSSSPSNIRRADAREQFP